MPTPLDLFSDHRPALRRQLGLPTATLLVVGGIIGGGIFFIPGEVARALPSAGWILPIWGFGGAIAFAGALTYAELGALAPDAGGPYVFIRDAFGSLPAFLCGWMLLTLIATGAEAAVALAFAGYLARYVDLAPAGGAMGVGAAAIILLSAANYFGVRTGAAVQNALTAAKIGALAFLIVGGLGRFSALGPPLPVAGPPAAPELARGLAAALVAVLFAIGGWQNMTMIAGEIIDPERTIPRALALGISVVVACYLAVNAVYLTVLGRDGLAASTAVAADTARRLFGGTGAAVVSLGVMLSILGFLDVVILVTPRVFYAMARDGVFFPQAARVHPRFATPHVSILIMAAWSLTLLVITRGAIGTLLSGVVFADWIFFGLGGASVIALRRKYPDAQRPFLTPGYPWVPALFVLAALCGIAGAIVAAPVASLLGTGLLLVGVGAYRVIWRRPAP